MQQAINKLIDTIEYLRDVASKETPASSNCCSESIGEYLNELYSVCLEAHASGGRFTDERYEDLIVLLRNIYRFSSRWRTGSSTDRQKSFLDGLDLCTSCVFYLLQDLARGEFPVSDEVCPVYLPDLFDQILSVYSHEIELRQLEVLLYLQQDVSDTVIFNDSINMPTLLNFVLENILLTPANGYLFFVVHNSSDSGLTVTVSAAEATEELNLPMSGALCTRASNLTASSIRPFVLEQARKLIYNTDGQLPLKPLSQPLFFNSLSLPFRPLKSKYTRFYSSHCLPLSPEALASKLKNVPGDRFRILVVDDNPLNLRILAAFVKEAGYQVDSAQGGAEALELFSTMSYDLLLLDCHMPRVDGFQVASHIRSLPAEKRNDTPIIAVTAEASSSCRSRCYLQGMDGFIEKPVNKKDIQRLIATILQERRY